MTRAEFRASTLLGAIFVVFGVSGLVPFLPIPFLELTSQGNEFIELLTNSGYFYVVKALEIVAGVLILSRRHLPLGIALLGPVVVNIFLFHLFLDPKNIAVGLVLLALWGFMAWRCRAYFAPIVRAVDDDDAVAYGHKVPKAQPTRS